MGLWNGFNWLTGTLTGFCKEASDRSGSETENGKILYRVVGMEGRNRLQSR